MPWQPVPFITNTAFLMIVWASGERRLICVMEIPNHAISPYARRLHTLSSLSLWEFTSEQYHPKAFPWLIGQWYAHNATHEELYSACLLALFKPWKAPADLDMPGILFQESLAVFLSSDSCACKDQVNNIKYVHNMGFSAIQIHLLHWFSLICYIPSSYNIPHTIDGINFETCETSLEAENSLPSQTRHQERSQLMFMATASDQ